MSNRQKIEQYKNTICDKNNTVTELLNIAVSINAVM